MATTKEKCGPFLADLLRRTDLGQESIAAATGTSVRQVNRWYARTSVPAKESVQSALAAHLGLPRSIVWLAVEASKRKVAQGDPILALAQYRIDQCVPAAVPDQPSERLSVDERALITALRRLEQAKSMRLLPELLYATLEVWTEDVPAKRLLEYLKGESAAPAPTAGALTQRRPMSEDAGLQERAAASS